jgi:hypothetical protein
MIPTLTEQWKIDFQQKYTKTPACELQRLTRFCKRIIEHDRNTQPLFWFSCIRSCFVDAMLRQKAPQFRTRARRLPFLLIAAHCKDSEFFETVSVDLRRNIRWSTSGLGGILLGQCVCGSRVGIGDKMLDQNIHHSILRTFMENYGL